MMLIEQTVVPDAALPVAQLREYLRLGSGFSGGAADEAALQGCLRAALSTIEARVAKAIFARRFKWTLAAWRDLSAQVLPKSPVADIVSLEIIDLQGVRDVIDPTRFRLEGDTHKPRLVAVSWSLPQIPVGGAAEISFDAGYGAAWADIPGDMAQATLMLAAHYYDHRGAIGEGPEAVPPAVRDLLAQYRVIRLFGGF